ncbi:YihY/virulence factor BrkB family protein [Kocuria sp. M1R5S2]|uniref:YihY/virulence factor BrkB family protein n=1 Tax=Kocuria rhizosphaerae TaxID=3376285 RepID=UPI00378C62DE
MSSRTGPRAGPAPQMPPRAVDRHGLRQEALRQRALLREKRAAGAGATGLAGSVLTVALSELFRLTPVRVIAHYLFHGGPLMAAGLSFVLIFASTALLVVGFSVIGMFLGHDPAVQQTVVRAVTARVPGLLNTGDGGVVPLELLEDTRPFTLTTIVGAVVAVFAGWRWVSGVRLAFRRLFEVPPSQGLPVLAVPRDLLGLVTLGVLLALSAVANAAASGFLGFLLDTAGDLGWARGPEWLRTGLTWGLSTLLVVVLDALFALELVRGVAGLRLIRRALLTTVLVAAAGNFALRYVGGAVIAGATSNPYLLSAALVVGVLVWFYLFSQILLFSAALGAIVQADQQGGRVHPRGEPVVLAVVPVGSLPPDGGRIGSPAPQR